MYIICTLYNIVFLLYSIDAQFKGEHQSSFSEDPSHEERYIISVYMFGLRIDENFPFSEVS